MNFRTPIRASGALALGLFATVALEAHITPQVTLRTKADVIRAAVPNAAHYTATTVHIGKPQLEQIVDRAHYTPDTDTVKFYSGENAGGNTIGTVVFTQVDTQHGPVEVGVGIGPDGAVTNVLVTRVTVETKPWVRDVEASGVLDRLKGAKAGDEPKALSGGSLTGMPGYMADVIATATYRGLALYSTLRAS
jgi:hypothetical protein